LGSNGDFDFVGGYGSCLCGCAGYGLPYGCDNAIFEILPQLEEEFALAIN